ncbi:hypothetical protein LC653_08590, partial [Nostoc sp. CHAB 5784]|nr:hypothetical protein [Nostoc mirabile CHAB5784]
SPTFIAVLSKYEKHYLLAIRSNHREFSLPEQEAKYGLWQEFDMNPVSKYRAYLISSSSKAFGIRIVLVSL